jgi:hypothetical protein
MHLEINTAQGGGYPPRHRNNNNSGTTLSYSVAGLNNDQGETPDQLILQGFEQLLNEHVGRLQTAIRRNEAFSLKPFPRYMNQKEVISYLGHEKVFWILVQEFGLKPIRQEHKCNVYCSKQVEEKCIQFERNLCV